MAFLDEQVGEGEWAMVITADHASMPDPAVSGGFQISTGRRRHASIQDEFDLDDDETRVVDLVQPSAVFLNEEELAEHDATVEDVARYVMTLTKAQVGGEGATPPVGAEDEIAFPVVLPSSMLPDLPCLGGMSPRRWQSVGGPDDGEGGADTVRRGISCRRDPRAGRGIASHRGNRRRSAGRRRGSREGRLLAFARVPARARGADGAPTAARSSRGSRASPTSSGRVSRTSASWDYIQHVPLFWYGPGHIAARGEVDRPVTVADIAPTQAALLDFDGFEAPDGEVCTRRSTRRSARAYEPPKLVVVMVWDAGGINVLEEHRRPVAVPRSR